MSPIQPLVRYLILCEDVQRDPENPNRVSLVHLIATLTATADPPFPLYCPEICVFLGLTGCRGPGDGWFEIVHVDSDTVVRRTARRALPLGRDPLELVGVTVRIQDCFFPEPGLYEVQFRYNGEVLAQQPLRVKEMT